MDQGSGYLDSIYRAIAVTLTAARAGVGINLGLRHSAHGWLKTDGFHFTIVAAGTAQDILVCEAILGYFCLQ